MNCTKVLLLAAVTALAGALVCALTIRCLVLANTPSVGEESGEHNEVAQRGVSVHGKNDVFANAVKHNMPTIVIQSSVDGGPWSRKTAIYPLKGQKVVLKVDKFPGGAIRWYQIIPDTSKIYKNANFPWEKEPYKWIGLAKICYDKKELTEFRGHWEIEPFGDRKESPPRRVQDRKSSPFSSSQSDATNLRFYHKDVGSFWFQAEILRESKIYRSWGIEDSDKRGLSPKVLRVSIRDGKGYIGYVTSFFNVPGLFGSVIYQSTNYIGVDCADVLMAAYGRWKDKPLSKNYNVAMLVSEWPKVNEFNVLEGVPDKRLKWGRDIRSGDLIAVRYRGSRQYQHIGALYKDASKNGFLDGDDLVIHAGPQPLHYSYMKQGSFDGHVIVLRQ